MTPTKEQLDQIPVLSMTRDQYIEWCKIRAKEYLDKGDLVTAVASMISDMNHRDDTKVSSFLAQFGTTCIFQSNNTNAVKRFIEGFH